MKNQRITPPCSNKLQHRRRAARLAALLLACVLLLSACRSSGGETGDDSAGSGAPVSSAQAQSQPGKGRFTGVWQRTGIPQSQAATITINEETKTSFFFSVNARSGANVGTTEGVAHLLTAEEATCTYNTGNGATVTFTIKDKVLHVTVTDHTPLGFGKGVTMDGSYVTSAPEYVGENWASEVFTSNADSISYADLLDGDANLFLTDVMNDGSLVNQYEVSSPAGEMYRFSVLEAGLGADILRTAQGTVFIGLTGYAEEYVLYTNDPGYRHQPPQEYEEIAAGPIQLRYVGQ